MLTFSLGFLLINWDPFQCWAFPAFGLPLFINLSSTAITLSCMIMNKKNWIELNWMYSRCISFLISVKNSILPNENNPTTYCEPLSYLVRTTVLPNKIHNTIWWEPLYYSIITRVLFSENPRTILWKPTNYLVRTTVLFSENQWTI